MNRFAEILTSLIKEEEISQSKLAEFLNVSQQTVSKYMNNKIEPGIDTIIKIAQYFDVTTDYLLGLEI